LTAGDRANFLAMYPWLTEDDLPGGRRRSTRKRMPGDKRAPDPEPVGDGGASDPSDQNSDDSSGPSEPDDEHPLDLAMYAEELEAIKDGMEYEPADDSVYFYIHLLKGEWTETHCHTAANGCCGQARGGVPAQWCKDYKFPRQCANHFRAYTRRGANILSLEYIQRATYFFKLYLSAVAPGFIFTQAHVDAYDPTTAFCDYAHELEVGSASFRRVFHIHNLVPMLGRAPAP
jgi:hypothetical protein